MKISLVNRLYLGFTIVVLLVILGGFLSWRTYKTQVHEARWVQHTYKVLYQAEQVQHLIYDLEAARRGYRSTFDHKFLDPYEAGVPKVRPALNQLRSMVTDNPRQEKNITELETAINGMLRFWDDLDHFHFDKTFSQNTIITDKEVVLVNKVQDAIDAISNEERRLLTIREQENTHSIDRAIATLIINNSFILLVGFILMFVTWKEFKSRIAAQQQLNDKLQEEQRLNKETTEQNWLLSVTNDIKDSLQGISNVHDLTRNSLGTLTSVAGFEAGAFYHYDERTAKLRMYGSVSMPATAPQEFSSGEGLTGQAAAGKNIQVFRNLPQDYWQIIAASGALRPETLVLVPLRIDGELLGIIELAAFRPVSDLDLRFLELAAKDIAVALNATNAREKVLTLLQQVQEQKEILVSQQEELRQSNEELSRQSEILQASEEELRVQEEELRQVNAEMTVKNNALEAARKDLAEKATELEASSRYKSEFLANMSHELRTPLNSVLILAKMLEENKDHNLQPRQVEYATIIHKSGSDLLRLINDILDLSKIEAGKVELTPEDVTVAGIIDDLSDLFDVVAQEKKIRFDKTVMPDVPAVIHTDKLRLEQVIRNLLSNSFKFTPPGGHITMRWVMHPGNALHISVTDTGPGIPAEKQQLIFEAFSQADGATTRKYGGTGLGLSISRELMLLLQGEIRLENSSAAGSTFTIVIPAGTAQLPPSALHKPLPVAAEPAPAEPVIQQPAAPGDDRNTIRKGDKLILIIEDDIFFADILRDFARNKGFKTIVAHNGQDGLFYARKYLPAAIILDMNLPVIDGHSILKILRSSEELKHILVHVVSGADLPAATVGNINGYTQKPIETRDLEGVFSNISLQLQARLKQVLLVSSGPLATDPLIAAKSQERNLETQYDIVTSVAAAPAFLSGKKYDGIILDIGTDLQTGLTRLRELTEMPVAADTPVIVYIDQDISSAEEQQLKKYAAAIVRNSSFSADRLMDELELFLYKIEKKVVAATPPSPQHSLLEGKTVLLADDDMRNVFSISALLEEQGIRVLTAADGREALSVLDKNPGIHLVLMDIMMPEMDGFEAMKHIRADVRFVQLPVIALTAKAMAGDRQQCIDAGASDYITKPVDSSKLLSLLHVWLS
ncbi:response regulator [Chitinophaga sp. Mgbs1]|uniref:histidine kinase n=1 Tax=Chitinophaga solisilvae TaxID=1233460 RepID=A0A433WHC8_9BACT|nr:response regulator [Chitinophaga solisilvae]